MLPLGHLSTPSMHSFILGGTPDYILTLIQDTQELYTINTGEKTQLLH